MSRHQAVRNLDYKAELDEFDGYSDEEDELSPEDRAAMTQGTIDVRASLGPAGSNITTAQIEESLWHYYYDLDKTVTYLVTKFIAPPPASTPKAPKTSSNSKGKLYFPTLLAWHSHSTMDPSPAEPCPSPLNSRPSLTRCQGSEFSSYGSLPSTSATSRQSHSHYFRHMPWGNIPKDRETVFIPPHMPRRGLLGGSGAPPKMSKLQMLAAARKKKAEEKNTQDKVEQTQAKMTELSVQEKPASKENIPLAGGFGKRLKTSETTAEGRMPHATPDRVRQERPQQPTAEVIEESKPSPEVDEKPVVEKARPSGFAQTLFGDSDASKINQQKLFTFAPAGLSPSILEAFSKPSPDDVVLAAQAKGSLSMTKKR